MIASYLTYYVIKPQARTNYGDFIDPVTHPMPSTLHLTALDGKPAALKDYEGKWIMLQVDGGTCAEPCRKKLHDLRQVRLAQGRESDRIERVWLITDDTPLDTVLMREYDGVRILRVRVDALEKWLPSEPGVAPFDRKMLFDQIYVIDPLGRLMMRFPKNADANLIKKDIGKLLRASSIG